MTLALSPHDQSLLAAATRALVTPLVAPSFEQWLGEVNRTLKDLLWADKASFMFPLGGGEIRAASDELPSPVLQSFMREKLPELEKRWGFRRRCLELGVFSRQLIYGSRLPVFYRSDYYNEYLVPNRAFDGMGMAAALDMPPHMVNLQLHHDRPTGRRFGTRGLALLRILYPAFRAGVHASRTLFLRRQQLASLLDAMTPAVALADVSARIVHRNRALVRMLEAEPGRAELEAAVSAAVRSCVATLFAGGISGGGGSRTAPHSLRRKVPVGEVTYTLSAALLAAGPSANEAAATVLVERSQRPVFPAAALRRRYRLTPRELEVVRLLGEGASNVEIARVLAISPATARHHTESAMSKLGVHARARIPPLLGALPVE